MRTIKFRVWDKEIKKMHICGEDVHDEITFENETNKAYYYNLQNGCGSLREDSDYILMQYTGLKDKNGKEIYEGDIVKVYDVIIAKVIWDNFYLGYFLYTNKENSIDTFEYGEQPLYFYLGSIEVIGNIYENKNLLGQEEN